MLTLLRRNWIILFLCGSVLAIVSLIFVVLVREPYRPLHLVDPQKAPTFNDDASIQSLVKATRSQIHYLQQQDPDKIISFAEDAYPISWLLISAQEFLRTIETLSDRNDINSILCDNYHVYQAGGREKQGKRRMLVTGYYEPTFPGALEKSAEYQTPIYYKPSSLITTQDKEGKKLVGRIDENEQFTTFWSRREIETSNILQGYEFAYLKDPFDAYLLHVQGSGRIRLADGSLLAVRYAASNGLEYMSIGKLLVDEKILSLAEVSIPKIREYLQQHPQELWRILHHNPRYIFFAKGDNLGPRGSSGEVLTPGRSIAIDTESLPAGTIGYLISSRPETDRDGNITSWKPLHRFVFPQDSGAAIKGTGRVDFYWGNGQYAETAANHMKQDGKLFFFVKKQKKQ